MGVFFLFPHDWSIARASFLILTFLWLLATDHMSFVHGQKHRFK